MLLGREAIPEYFASANDEDRSWALWCLQKLIEFCLMQQEYIYASHHVETLLLQKAALSPEQLDAHYESASSCLEQLIQAGELDLADRVISAKDMPPKHVPISCADLICSWSEKDITAFWRKRVTPSPLTEFEMALTMCEKLWRRKDYEMAKTMLVELSEYDTINNNHSLRMMTLSWLATVELKMGFESDDDLPESVMESYRRAAAHARDICASHGYTMLTHESISANHNYKQLPMARDHREVLIIAARKMLSTAKENMNRLRFKLVVEGARSTWRTIYDYLSVELARCREEKLLLACLVEQGNSILRNGGDDTSATIPDGRMGFRKELDAAKTWIEATPASAR
jgi:hypothetical protein